jgi:hypothetical protein
MAEMVLAMLAELAEMLDGINVAITTEITINANAKPGEFAAKVITTYTYSGGNINTPDVWETLKEMMLEDMGDVADDTNHSVTVTDTPPITMTDLVDAGLQINQNNTEMKIPANSMGEEEHPEVILSRQ